MDQECEVKHFGCKFLPKINLGKKTDLERCQLLGTTKYGHVLSAHNADIKVYRKSDIHSVYDNEKASSTVDAPAPLAVLTFTSSVSHLVISCDSLVIAVITVDKKISLVDVRSLESSPAVFAQTSLLATCADIMWNPGMPTVLATATVTGEVTVWELKGDTLVKISSKPTFGASCLSWSSKGKQLAVGTNDGKIFNLKPTLDEARCTQAPSLFSGTALVRDLFWISTFEYIAVYEHNDVIKVVHIQNQKDKNIPTKFTDFDDIFFSEPGRNISVLFSQILPWNTLVLGCSRGIELGVIGQVPEKAGQFLFNLDEGSRAEMPYAGGEPSYPVGMCIDYNHNQSFVINEKTIQPCPVLLALTSEGVLSSFKLLNINVATPLVDAIEQAPALPLTRSKSLFNLKNETKQTEEQKDTVKSSFFGPLSTNFTPKITQAQVSAPAPVSFAPPLPIFGHKLPTVPEVKSEQQSSGLFSPLPQHQPKSQEVKVTKEPLVHKTSLPPANTTLEKLSASSTDTKKKESLENHANLDSVFAKSIDDEIKKFSFQLEQHKAASGRLEDVKDILSKEDIKEVTENIALIDKKLSAVHSIISTINKDVCNDKDVLLVALASLEDTKGYYNCYNDPSYLALLKSKPLDKMTRKLRDDLFSKFAQMQSLVDELNLQLDTEWENMHSNKKSTPTSRTIYKTLSQHRTISKEQEKAIDTLLKQLSNLSLKPIAKSTSDYAAGKSISPVKQKILKGVFESRRPKSKVITSPAKLNISSFNSSYAKPQALPAMRENYEQESEGDDSEIENQNMNEKYGEKPEPVKFGIPTLSYSENPKFDFDDPSRLAESEDRVPSVVLKYMPSTPQVVPSTEEKVKGAKELVSKMVDFVQKEKDILSAGPDKSYAEQFIPVMRTKGPVAPGQAPNAVIQPVSSIKETAGVASSCQQSTSTNMFGAPSGSSIFGLPKTNSTSPKDTSSFSHPPEHSTGLFGFTSTPPIASKTPVVDSKSIFAGQTPVSGAGSLFAPVSTPPLNTAQLGTKTTPILVTPRTKTPPQKNVFGTLKAAASNRPSSPADNFPVFGVPVAEFDQGRDSPSVPLGYNESSEESSASRASSAASETDVKALSSTESTGQDGSASLGVDSKTETNIFLSSGSPKTSDNLFAAAPSSSNIFALANSSSSAGNIFTSKNNDGSLGSGGSTLGFFAPVPSSEKEDKKDRSPSIGGSLLSSQEKSPVTPPQNSEAGKDKLGTTQVSSGAGGLLNTGKSEKPASAKSLFGSDSKENKGASDGGLFNFKISNDEKPFSSPTKNVFGSSQPAGSSQSATEVKTADSSGLFAAKSSPFTSNLFGDKPSASPFGNTAPPVSTETATSLFSGGTVSGASLFGAAPTTVTAAATGGLFGSTAATSASGGLFSSTTTTPTASGLFGTTTTTPTASGLFGTTTTTPTGSGLFGTTTTTPTGSGLFGTTTTTPTGSGLFGTTATAPTASGLFGTTTTTPTTGGTGLFAAPQTTNVFGAAPTSNVFGSSLMEPSKGFVSNPNTGNVPFGNNTSSSTTSSSGFGNTIPSSGFGSSSGFSSNNSNTESPFGVAPAFAAAPAFGPAPTFGSSQGFGSAPAFGGVSSFGGTPAPLSFGSQPTGGSVFGASSGFGSTSGGTGPTFGGVAAAGGGIFGANNNNAPSGFGDIGNQNSGGFLGNNQVQNNNGGFLGNNPGQNNNGGFLGNNPGQNNNGGFLGNNPGQNDNGGFLGNNAESNNNKPSSFSSWR